MNSKTTWITFTIIIAATLLLWQLGVGEPNESVDTTPVSETQAQLMSETWVWQETVMSNGDVTTPDDADAFTLTFTADEILGTTDCNSFGGSYDLNETEISFGPMRMTRMFCEGSQEQEFVDAVTESSMVYFEDGEDLVLLLPYDSGSVIFTAATSTPAE